jgi:hypothetical protein
MLSRNMPELNSADYSTKLTSCLVIDLDDYDLSRVGNEFKIIVTCDSQEYTVLSTTMLKSSVELMIVKTEKAE